MARIFRIHPAIGVARVGNANRDTFFIGAETPGIAANFDFARGEFRLFRGSRAAAARLTRPDRAAWAA